MNGASTLRDSRLLISARSALAPRMYIKSPSMIEESCCSDAPSINGGPSILSDSAISNASFKRAILSSRRPFAIFCSTVMRLCIAAFLTWKSLPALSITSCTARSAAKRTKACAHVARTSRFVPSTINRITVCIWLVSRINLYLFGELLIKLLLLIFAFRSLTHLGKVYLIEELFFILIRKQIARKDRIDTSNSICI